MIFTQGINLTQQAGGLCENSHSPASCDTSFASPSSPGETEDTAASSKVMMCPDPDSKTDVTNVNVCG